MELKLFYFSGGERWGTRGDGVFQEVWGFSTRKFKLMIKYFILWGQDNKIFSLLTLVKFSSNSLSFLSLYLKWQCFKSWVTSFFQEGAWHPGGHCDFTIANLANAYNQGSTITIKSPYVCQTFGVRDVRGQIPEIIYQVSYLLPSDFPNNFS